MNRDDHEKNAPRFYREMTVAHIREQKDADHVEVVFLESARFYKLSRGHPDYDEKLLLLRDALSKGRMLKVGFASMDSDDIEDIKTH